MCKTNYTYLTIEEYIRVTRKKLYQTPVFLIPYPRQEKFKNSSFEPNGDVTKMRWKIMA